jgi:hypothetical protein
MDGTVGAVGGAAGKMIPVLPQRSSEVRRALMDGGADLSVPRCPRMGMGATGQQAKRSYYANDFFHFVRFRGLILCSTADVLFTTSSYAIQNPALFWRDGVCIHISPNEL